MSLKTKQINVVSYNSDWPKMFEAEAALIKQALGEGCLVVHHIGSTAVPGLSAKEDLDILCVVSDLSSSLSLQEIGYAFKGEFNIPLRYFFSKNTQRSKVNLHVVEKDHGFIPLNLCFRDYLRTHDEARQAYTNLKEELLKDPKSYQKGVNGFSGYNRGKDLFIKDILDKAVFDSLTINFCMHDQEWQSYHRICKEQIFGGEDRNDDRSHPTANQENQYHFVLYRGPRIVCIAHVEFLSSEKAVLRVLAADEPYKRQGYEEHMIKILEKWVKLKGGKNLQLSDK